MSSSAALSLQPKAGNPVTTDALLETCQGLNIQLKSHEERDYCRLLGAFHDVAEEVMAWDGKLRRRKKSRMSESRIAFHIRPES